MGDRNRIKKIVERAERAVLGSSEQDRQALERELREATEKPPQDGGDQK